MNTSDRTRLDPTIPNNPDYQNNTIPPTGQQQPGMAVPPPFPSMDEYSSSVYGPDPMIDDPNNAYPANESMDTASMNADEKSKKKNVVMAALAAAAGGVGLGAGAVMLSSFAKDDNDNGAEAGAQDGTAGQSTTADHPAPPHNNHVADNSSNNNKTNKQGDDNNDGGKPNDNPGENTVDKPVNNTGDEPEPEPEPEPTPNPDPYPYTVDVNGGKIEVLGIDQINGHVTAAVIIEDVPGVLIDSDDDGVFDVLGADFNADTHFSDDEYVDLQANDIHIGVNQLLPPTADQPEPPVAQQEGDEVLVAQEEGDNDDDVVVADPEDDSMPPITDGVVAKDGASYEPADDEIVEVETDEVTVLDPEDASMPPVTDVEPDYDVAMDSDAAMDMTGDDVAMDNAADMSM